MRSPCFRSSFPPLTVTAAAALILAGCTGTPNDKQIGEQVQSQLAADSALQKQPISVSVSHGVVTLSGNVSGPGSRELAGSDAAHVKGVKTVLNNLFVESGSPYAGPNQPSGNSGYAMMNGHPIQSYSDSAPPPASTSVQYPGSQQQQFFVIPAGTRIRVQLDQTLSTRSSQAGEPFSGTLASPVQVNGQTIIRSGAQASGTVIEAKKQGRFAGQAILAVRLESVRDNGRNYPVQTSTVERFERGKGKRSALLTGGGAGLGALIGGLTGGGDGALIGGLVGGGGGAAGSAFTGSHNLVLPAESILTFRLENDVRIR